MSEYGDGDPPGGAYGGVSVAMRTAMRFFLGPPHYRTLHRLLSEKWKDRHSLSAATQLMKAHGVEMSPMEEADLASIKDEEQMIETLVQRVKQLPSKRPEQFEHFFLQLSFIASTTARLRASLEAGQPDLTEEALESAENVGVLPYLLKMAVSQAGTEVLTLEADHDVWLGETDDKMSPLLTSASAAMVVQKELTQASATLLHYQAQSRDKTRSVLLGMVDGYDKWFLEAIFLSFADYVSRVKREEEIKAEYQEAIDAANKELYDYKQAQLTNVKGVLSKQSQGATDLLLTKVLDALRSDAKYVKEAADAEKEAARLAAEIAGFSDAAAEKAKAVMSRLGAGTEAGLYQTTFQAFKTNVEMMKKEREMAATLAKKEAEMAAFIEKQKEGAKSVLASISGATDVGLMSSAFASWRDSIIEEKKENERREALQAKSTLVTNFVKKNKVASMTAAEKVVYLADTQMLLWVMTVWKREAKLERIRRMGKEKHERRKRELVGVKGLFKNFASELENSLDKGTPRVDVRRKTASSNPPLVGPVA